MLNDIMLSAIMLNVKWHLGQYLQPYIFIVTYEWALQVEVLHYTRLEGLTRGKHSNLLSLFISYDENKVLWKWHMGQYSQHFIFIVTYEWAL